MCDDTAIFLAGDVLGGWECYHVEPEFLHCTDCGEVIVHVQRLDIPVEGRRYPIDGYVREVALSDPKLPPHRVTFQSAKETNGQTGVITSAKMRLLLVYIADA